MRHVWWFALAVSTATVGPATAQLSGTATGTTAGTTGATGTTGAAAGGGTLSGLGGGTGSTTTLGDASLGTPAINALMGPGTVPTVLNQSNVLGGYYANPYFQGRPASATIAPGGFGAALYGAAGGGTTGGGGGFPNATGNTINARSGATAAGGRTQGIFGQQTGGFGQQGGANQSGVVVPLPRQISYSATLNFKAPIATMPQVATGLRATLDRSTMLGNPRGVGLTMDGNVVVLRGNVATDDELRLVEGMVRLTPGVRDVRNELKVGPATP